MHRAKAQRQMWLFADGVKAERREGWKEGENLVLGFATCYLEDDCDAMS